MDRYISVPLTFNKYCWGRANVVNDVEECNRLLKIGFSKGTLQLTAGGHLKKEPLMRYGAVWISKRTASLEFLIYNVKGLYRFVFRPALDTDEDRLTGVDALKELRKECGAMIKAYAIVDNDKVAAVKATIPRLKIHLTKYGKSLIGATLRNIVHIDINSAFPAGVVDKHPHLKPFFQYHYERRKEDSIHKAVMNYAIGACQSLKIRGTRYPQLAKDAIEWTNDKLNGLTKELERQSYKVLGYNTDGIFYERVAGAPLYTDEDEGTAMGQWKTDSVFEMIRFKSAGAYEYVKDGKYKAVVRGSTKLDRIKPREKWEWGDIYKATEIVLVLNKENQLVELEVDDGEV